MDKLKEKPVLLTGATGFIGQCLYPELIEEGYEVLCTSRNPDRARNQYPEREWIQLDVQDPESVQKAFELAGTVFYLIHEMSGGKGYREREKRAAEMVRQKADEAGINRVVYLGGVAPDDDPSEHLRSRLETGRILRNGSTPTVELRASMVIGTGSSSWKIVRDLSARLPLMILPRWTQSRTQPVFVDDVVQALVGALEIESANSEWYDIPGPETLTVEEIFRRTSKIMNKRTFTIPVPVLTPKLSSYWLKFVTRADFYLARELVEGLKHDLLAKDNRYWDQIGHQNLTGFDDAVRLTLERSERES